MVVILLSLAPSGFGASNDSLTDSEIAQGYRHGVLIAKPRERMQQPVSASALAAAEQRAGTKLHRSLAHLGNLRVLELDGSVDDEEGLRRLRADGNYEYVERDYIRHSLVVPDDPKLANGDQWPLKNTGQSGGTAGADIGALIAWDTLHDTTPDTIVAVIDSGLRLTHEDIRANLWTSGNVNGFNATVASGSAKSTDPSDDNGHGTHVAGIIGATGNNGVGIAGIAWKVRLMPLKFLDSRGYGSVSGAIACINYALANHATIINASYGSFSFSQAELDAIRRARDTGVVFVAAAGNDGAEISSLPTYPAAYTSDNIVAVASTTRKDELASTSTFGSGLVELAAPGASILSLGFSSDNSYVVLSGTSMAAPHVTGALALLHTKFGSDNYRQNINRLLGSVDVLPALVGKVHTAGRLNVAKALASTNNRPFNDDFAHSAVIAGANNRVRSSNAGATLESGEPNHGAVNQSASLWWSWTAPLTTRVTIDTKDSGFDTVLAIYTGTTLANLKLVGNSDDTDTPLSSVTFNAIAGTTYSIAVTGKNGSGGSVNLNINSTPVNDDYANAQLMVGPSATTVGNNSNATREPGENLMAPRNIGRTLWYKWVATSSRKFEVSVSSYYSDPYLGIYTGSSVTALTKIVTDDDGGIYYDSLAEFNATAGTTYYFCVDNASGSPGAFNISVADADWQYRTTSVTTATPAAAPDGTLYLGSYDSYLHAVAPDGTRKWRYLTGSYVESGSPVVGPDGVVYFGSDDNKITALAADSTVKWAYATGGHVVASPALAPDGTLYVKSDDNKLYAFKSSDGTLKWTAPVNGTSYGGPSLAPDGTVLTPASTDHALVALRANGTEKWRFDAGGEIRASPALGADGTSYLGTMEGRFFAIAPDGKERWHYDAGGPVSGSAALDGRGLVYFGSYDRKLHALEQATGKQRWEFLTADAIHTTTPLVTADGNVFIASDDNLVYLVDSAGKQKRVFAAADIIRSSPVIAGGRLCFSSYDGKLYAFPTSELPAPSAWPMHRQNAQRTGTQSLAVTAAPSVKSVVAGSSVTLTASASGAASLTYQWKKNGAVIAGATVASLALVSATEADAGDYSVVLTGGSSSLEVAHTVLTVSPLPPPVISTVAMARSAFIGDTVTISVAATGTSALSYQWKKDGVIIAGASGATYTLVTSTVADSGTYSVVVTAAGVSADGTIATLTVTPRPNPGRLVNLSVRTNAGSGAQLLFVGVVLGGGGTSGTTSVLIRATGPSLAAFGVPRTLADPKLELYSGATKINGNDDWAGDATITAVGARVGAFPLVSATSKDAALYTEPVAGAYTIQISGADGSSGNTLAEIYDATIFNNFTLATPRLVNVSARTQVGAGGDILIAGFTVGGATSKTILIRAVGPTLAAFGVPDVLVDPKLELYNGATKIDENDNWGGSAAITTAFASVGAFALDPSSKDAALLVTLPPGSYTAQVSGVNNTTGSALVEVYEVP